MTNRPFRVAICLAALLTAGSAAGVELYVSPGGDDGNAGTRAKPLKTLRAARDAVRAVKQTGGHRILLRGGKYFMGRTLELDKRDSGSRPAPNVVTSCQGERARLVGGVQIPASAVRKTSDRAVLDRILSPEARKRIYEIDLKAQGITDYGKLIPRGFHRAVVPYVLELSLSGKRLRMAQWPNDFDSDKSGRGAGSQAKDIHYIKMPPPVSRGSRPRYGDYSNKGGIIPYDYDRPNHYRSKDIIIAGFLGNGYSFDTIPVKTIDRKKKTIELADAHMYGLGSGRKWGRRGHTEYFFLNVLEEIDQPGESYLDRATGTIYFLLPEGVHVSPALEVLASMLEGPIVAIEGASHFHLKNVNVESGRGMGIYMEGGRSNRIEGCTIRNLGTAGVMLGKGVDADKVKYRHEYTGTPTARSMGSIMCHTYANTTFFRNAGRNHRIDNCHIHDVGVIGVYLGGGNRKTLEPGGNVVSNCRIHNTQNVERSFFGAVTIDGVGNRVEHCEIRDLFDIAVWVWGNDHEIKFNNIHHCLLAAAEKGLIYSGRDPGAFNLQVENNFIHHNGNPYGYTAVVHMDDFASGLSFKNNICYRNDRKTFFNSGYLHEIENNIFVDNFAWDTRPCKYEHGIRHGQSPAAWRKILQHPLYKKRMFQVVDVRKPPYSARYPKLAEIVNDPKKSKNTVVVRGNVCINSGIVASHRKTRENPGGGNVQNNWVRENVDLKKLDLGFADIDKLDFRIRANSEIFRKVNGFKRIPFEQMGPMTSEKSQE